MGNCASATQGREPASQRSADIDRIIEEDSKKFKKECKILLLGSGESGKSTVVKQMKIIHQDGFSVEERIAYRATIYQNLLESAQAIVFAMHKLSIEPMDPQNHATAEQIAHYELDLSSIDSSFRFPEQLASSINRLWHDPVIPQIMDYHSSEFYLMDSASYFFTEAERIGSADYTPNETDVLRCRQKSTGIVETRFNVSPLSIHMFDVGGQRSERKKWIHCFESVTSIIFCTALSEYDQVLLEQRNQNRMAESLELFDSIINSRWFLRTSIILFMNKIDVFRNKLPKVPLERYFPEYTGGSDINKAAKYILWRFMQANRARLSVYPHLTQATDTSNIRLVFAAVKETILQNALRDYGIL
ncbi:G-protein alpha subunit [Thelephora ganbajun]|uniref:G-protein alpha subunit n=1 Tax=Thelephora ganbajun TaxID=370292 RepID=A0ACB6ZK74_THEGA|nr:G-protein alpha subunit [Thelephora ganbajun]